MTPPRLVGLSANVQRPSKTRTLVDAVLHEAGAQTALDARILDFVDAGPGLGAAWTRDQLPTAARDVLAAIEAADGLVVGSPVYKGAYTGLFKHLFDLVDPGALAGKPVAIVATGGGARHALVVEHAFRPLFGFFGALQIPTAVYASDADFTDGALTEAGVRARAAEAGGQLAALLAHRAAAAAPVELAAAE
ncbi:FMN reductase [Methylobacterium longum]|uniref:FMN reductase n=1 Tax=Methylobacterium longum TaxID=767694 RepID=A0ABT8AKH7_9HYPH|nr:FMN reductase [Methylobacterium longum]MDN3569879.1 FMN reductase [Methylobacterium longum]GJE14374.1 NADH-dependent FMN reductase SfnF [Methylobacterium longum]